MLMYLLDKYSEVEWQFYFQLCKDLHAALHSGYTNFQSYEQQTRISFFLLFIY